MTNLNQPNKRILVIDDNAVIHEDFRKILVREDSSEDALAEAAADLFGETRQPGPPVSFELSYAFQGEEGVAAVRDALQSGMPFAMIFLDVRMPPGIDGVEAAAKIWEIDPDVQVVLCTAYADYSWEQIGERLGHTDRLVILRKPFDAIEVLQLASALTEKWSLLQRAKTHVGLLERSVGDRTRELEKANASLKATQEMFTHFLSKSPAVLYSLKFKDSELVPAWVSENYKNLTGRDASDWYENASSLSYVEPADRMIIHAARGELLNSGFVSVEYRIQQGNGIIRWVRDDQKLLRDDAGCPGEIVGCWTDITEQRVLQDQLRQAQKMESVGQLAGGVAHDFNNLLMVIQGHTEILLTTEKLSQAVTEGLNEIRSAADKAGNLTRQLLAFSRKQIMQRKQIDLNEIVSSAGRLLSRTLGEHITVKIECEAKLPALYADQNMIDQVVMNLALNARDAMPSGGQLTFKTSLQRVDAVHANRKPDARRGTFLCLSVSDSGCGISPENLTHIFEPFFTTKAVGKGTGLGLATVYGIAKQHGGWVEVESSIGHGATFHVFMPIATGTVATVTSPAPSPAIISGNETILLVEDDPAVRSFVQGLLSRCGYHVHSASSGADALAQYSERLNEIDLLITDIVMPDGILGWELATQFQNRKPSLRTIFMSGYNPEITEIDFASRFSHGNKFLQKPFNMQKLAETIRQCLETGGENKS